MVSILTEPDVFEGGLGSFSQQLDLGSASVAINTTSKANGISAKFMVTVDANSNQIVVIANTWSPVQFSVVVQSLHPTGTNFTCEIVAAAGTGSP